MSTLLYTLAVGRVGVPCPSVAVVCWWRTRANQFLDDFFVIILCHILRLKCIKFDFNRGSTPDPAGGAYICSVPPDSASEMTYIVSSGALNSTHSLTPPDDLDLGGSTSKGRKGKERGRRGTDVGRKGMAGGGGKKRKECNGGGWTDPPSLKRGCANANNAWMNV